MGWTPVPTVIRKVGVVVIVGKNHMTFMQKPVVI